MDFVSDEQRKAVFASMRDRGDLIYRYGSYYSRRNRPCTYGKYSYKRYPEYHLYTEDHLKILLDAQTSLQKQISTLEKQITDWQNVANWLSIMRLSSLNEQLAIIKAEIKAIEAQGIRVKSTTFVSDEQRKAVFASMRDRGVLIEYGKSSYTSSSKRKFKNSGSLRVSKVMYKAVCSDCGAETQVSFKPDPKRPVYCRECLPKYRKLREKSKGKSQNREGLGNLRKMHKAICSDCGAETQVSFKPDPKRPVYCRECLPKHRKLEKNTN